MPGPKLELISAAVCPFAQRSRITALEKGLDFKLTEIDLKQKPDWFLGLSPTGKVPLLKVGADRVLYESHVVNEYLNELSPSPALLPDDPFERAQARLWVDRANTAFVPVFYKLLLAQEDDRRAQSREKLEAELAHLEAHGPAGDWWMGKAFSLADIAFYPFFERFAPITHYRGVDLPKGGKLAAWVARMQTRPSVIATQNPPETYIRNYAKYADGSADGITAREMREN